MADNVTELAGALIPASSLVVPEPEVLTPDEIILPPPRRIFRVEELESIFERKCEQRMLVEKVVPEASLNLLSAASGTGKTYLAYHIAGGVAHGGVVFGEKAQKRRALYLDAENPDYEVQRRLRDLGIAKTPNLIVWGGWHPEPPPGPTDARIIAFAKKYRPLMIWDSLIRFHPGDEKDSSETADFMEGFRRLAHLGATVIILHHTGKGENTKNYRGSTDIEAAVDMAFLITKEGNSKLLEQVNMKQFKSRLGIVPERLLTYRHGKGFDSTITAQLPSDVKDPLKGVKGIVEATPGLLKTKVVEQAMDLGIPKADAEKALECQDVFRFEGGKGRSQHTYLVG